MKGCRACYHHGGAAYAKRLTPRRLVIRAARAIVRRAIAEGRVSPELATHPAWLAAGCLAYAPHRPALLAAWGSVDPEAWPRAVAALERDMVARPRGQRRDRKGST